MQEDKQTKFDQFIRNRMKEEGIEKPSLNFTHAVICKIETLKTSSDSVRNRPLIPKYFWYAGAAIVLAMFSYSIYGNVDWGISWPPAGKMQQTELLKLLEKLPSFNVSNIYVYAFIGLAFFVGIQVYLLKVHFDKRYFLD